jgi:hypothetical protein
LRLAHAQDETFELPTSHAPDTEGPDITFPPDRAWALQHLKLVVAETEQALASIILEGVRGRLTGLVVNVGVAEWDETLYIAVEANGGAYLLAVVPPDQVFNVD